MFSKPKISDTPATSDAGKTEKPETPAPTSSAPAKPAPSPAAASTPKPSPSLLSNDLMIKGNVITTGDIQIEGTIEGDVRAHLLTVGESATIRGEIVADDVVVNGRVVGRVRGLKVRLTTSAKVEGDIVHKTIAIESGAHFEGSVQRQEDPLGESGAKKTPIPGASVDTAAE
ncbi:polymer-forming cytoskeletal protein [Rhodobacteraceae bacterium NNCM2]|nr:polymer-forming cytoskeletal protein [Coraliihabitans acroporae]